jgi:isopenicillin N synthase-like dioxygenase
MRQDVIHPFRAHDRTQTCHELHSVVMRAIALGLDLDEMFFEDKINEQYHNLRLLSYPSVKTSLLKEGRARAGAHSGGFPF